MPQLQGVLLDIDGTLVLSNEAHARAWSDALGEAGYDVPAERIVGLIGMGGDRVLPALVDGLDDETEPGKTISRRRGEIFLEHYAPDLEAAPGSRELVERIRADGLRIVAASSAKENELKVLLRIAGVDDLIDVSTSSDDAESSKPAPDIVQVALERSGLAAEAAIMIGDTRYDIESAGRAGVGVIAVRCGGWDDAGLAGALAIYDDPADLIARYGDSPLALARAR